MSIPATSLTRKARKGHQKTAAGAALVPAGENGEGKTKSIHLPSWKMN
jgi:hypothetical protein